jgi:quercetin 2,3-dioxygenase
MTTRTINHIETATKEMVGAFKVLQALPSRNLKQVDPFLLIHHLLPIDLEPGNPFRIPPHPHAGFEVVTYLIDGEFFHRDSKGNDQFARGGDINWMTAGSGIIHSEGPTESFLEKGGRLQLLQVWINLPAKYKSDDPSFRNYPGAGFPEINNEGFRLKLLIGNYGDMKSPVITRTPMFFYHLKLKKGRLVTIPVNREQSAALYILDGKLRALNQELGQGQLLDFNLDGDQLVFSAITDTDLVIFGGLPLKEKLVTYGPFVMNSFEEIQQAIGDYEKGRMGQLNY